MNKSVEKICNELDISIQDVIDEAQRYFEAKIARPQYEAYLSNADAQAKLYIDCYHETLLSYITIAEAKLKRRKQTIWKD